MKRSSSKGSYWGINAIFDLKNMEGKQVTYCGVYVRECDWSTAMGGIPDSACWHLVDLLERNVKRRGADRLRVRICQGQRSD